MKKTFFVFALVFCTILATEAQSKVNNFEFGEDLTIKNEKIAFNFFGKKDITSDTSEVNRLKNLP